MNWVQGVLLAVSNGINVYCLVQITREGVQARRALDEARAFYRKASDFHHEAGVSLAEARRVAGIEDPPPPTFQ